MSDYPNFPDFEGWDAVKEVHMKWLSHYDSDKAQASFPREMLIHDCRLLTAALDIVLDACMHEGIDSGGIDWSENGNGLW